MPDKPVAHGNDHRPGGFDPTQPGAWHYVSDGGGISAWNSGTTYDPGDTVTHDVFVYLCLVGNTDKEPNVASNWANFWIIDVPLFQNSWANSTFTANSVPMRYRVSVGMLNYLDKDNGSIFQYGEHTLEIQGDVTGGNTNTTVFTIPPAYQFPYDVPGTGHNDAGTYVSVRLYMNGNFVGVTP